MTKRVSVSKCKVRGARAWRVRWHENGKVRRKFFGGLASAQAFAAQKRGEQIEVRQQLALMSQADQEKLIMVFNEAQRRGVDVLSFLSAPVEELKPVPTIRKVIDEMLAV